VWPFVVAAVVLLLLIVAVFVADAAAAGYAREQIRTQLVSALGLPADAEVGVDIGSGSVLLQAIRGRLDTVDVTVPRLAFGDLVGAAVIHATAVPLDTTKPLGTLSASYRVDAGHLRALATNLSGVDLDTIALASPEIVATSHVTVLGAKIPIGLGLEPSARSGRLVFTPSSIRVAGRSFSARALRASPIFGGLAKLLLRQQPFCVAQYLPAALTVRSAKVVGHRLVAGFTANGATMRGPDFTTKGSCS
jgi:hypothetical protein